MYCPSECVEQSGATSPKAGTRDDNQQIPGQTQRIFDVRCDLKRAGEADARQVGRVGTGAGDLPQLFRIAAPEQCACALASSTASAVPQDPAPTTRIGLSCSGFMAALEVVPVFIC